MLKMLQTPKHSHKIIPYGLLKIVINLFAKSFKKKNVSTASY